MLKYLKHRVLSLSGAVGLSHLIERSSWRQGQLLILGYHGIATTDEHEWDPLLYLSVDRLRARLQHLRDEKFDVLPLSEGYRRLRLGTLPPRSVCITFDDGFLDFFTRAYPLLQEFGFPATVYLTTYYSFHQLPVFDPMFMYLTWRGSLKHIDRITLRRTTPSVITLDIADGAQRLAAFQRVRRMMTEGAASAVHKDELLCEIAEAVAVDMCELKQQRKMYLMNPDEAASLDPALVDIQMHTHSHKVPLNREAFLSEIDRNAEHIRHIRPNAVLQHFCYPNGLTDERFLPWLRERNIVTATTCEPGMARQRAEPLLLPRLIDTMSLSPLEFSGWTRGIARFIPRRPMTPSTIDAFSQ